MTLLRAFEQMVKNPVLVAVRGQGAEREVVGFPPAGFGESAALMQREADDDEHQDWEVTAADGSHN